MSSLPSSIVPLLQDDPNRLPTTTTTESPKKLALIPFIFLIYFEVSGGPFGEESTVDAAGPLFAILGFLIFPFVWCIPEALVTAELSTTFPGNGGSVIWAHKAFGPFMGSLMGFLKLISGIINMAAYPVLGVDYLKRVFPIFSSGVPRYIAIVILTLFLSFVNYTGLTIVAYTALCLGIISLCPILALTLISIPKLVPARWFSLGQKGIKKDWTLFFNTLFWNLNSWDNASTLAGEVDQPQKTYPRAIFSAVIFVCLAYLFPLLAATGALPLHQENWTNGYLATAGQLIGGKWLKDWIELGAALSVIGSYEAQLSSCAYQVLGMADLGVVPFFFGVRSKWFNTPWIGIFIATLIALAVSFLNFADIVSSMNFLYSLGMMVEFASFLWLRRVMPIRVAKSYKVPLPMSGLVIMCLVPCGFLVYVVTIATKTVYLISALLTVVGIVWYFLMKLCKARNWVKFNDSGERGDRGEDEDFES